MPLFAILGVRRPNAVNLRAQSEGKRNMPDDKQQLLEHFRQMRVALLAAIEGLSEAVMTDRSIDGWSVKDHLAHLALWDDVRAEEVVRISGGYESAWRMSGEQDAAYNALGYDLRRELPLEQVRWELASSRQRLLDAIEGASARGLDGSLYGEAPVLSTHEAQHAGWIRRWRDERGL